MEVDKKSVGRLLKSNVFLLIGIFVSAPFFWGISKVVSWLILNALLGYNDAYRYDEIAGSFMFSLLLGVYLYFLINIYRRSSLKIDGDDIVVRGRSGWKVLDESIPLRELKSIRLGRHLEFTLSCGTKMKFEGAYILFEQQSLMDFLNTIEAQGVSVRST
ncbi:TPA: hypothetical protein P0E24_005078 [Vibrio campbellii]|nr:hypothetical protein [Vibrio campbellii]HDM8245871.1 hypothetical protein [Vibrio campbellii]